MYCHVAYLTYIQSTSCEMSGWMKPILESGLPGESHGQRSLAACNPWGRTESDMTEVTEHARTTEVI